MEYEDLLVEIRDGIAILTLNTPQKRNAITRKMRGSLLLAVNNMAKDDDVRVVIVTGAGDAFCAGGDIGLMKERMDGKLVESRYEHLQQVGYWGDLFPRLDKPVIAAINGVAVGAGFSLAMSCDIRIASEKARFGSSFVLLGLVPDCGLTYYLPKTIGTSKALELMFTGDIIDAAAAKQLGIVSLVTRHEELMKTTQELAAKIVRQPPVAIELTKRLVYRSILDDISRHIDCETYAQQLGWRTEEFKSKASAFFKK
jgi:2-(1,2-epoxy-1,2-dihydrophenyl)acetyl-CoA isomerase